jgi:prepilin-type N-terminal cleavage/methylation domain-containing protein
MVRGGRVDIFISSGGHIKRTQQIGFSLIEIAIVLVVIAILSVGALGLISSVNKQRQYTDTRRNLEKVETALAQFVAREKRLPCPADGALATGLEVPAGGGTCNAMARGVVPWITLGLSETDTTDGWFNRFTYRTSPALTAAGSMNFSDCDAAGLLDTALTPSGCITSPPCATTATCTRLNDALAGKGLAIQNLVGATLANNAGNTGAAYVLISHGENTSGAYNNSSILVTGSPATGTKEQINANNQALQSFYVADNINANAAPAYFDDIVVYKTVHWVVGQAKLDARSH